MLAPFARTSGPRYSTADWLLSPLDSELWLVRFRSMSSVNWRIPLPDGTMLTDRVHARLLSTLRAWLLARFHVDFTGGRRYAKQSARNIVASNLHCIDYLLLRADKLGILSHGLSALSINDLKAMISGLCSSSHVSESVYEWPARLTNYLRSVAHAVSESDLAKARSIAPCFDTALPAIAARLTSLNDNEIVRARAWMLANGTYDERSKGARYSLHLPKLGREIYRGTLLGCRTIFQAPPELYVGSHALQDVELSRVPVTNQDRSGPHRGVLSRQVRCICVLALLKSEGFESPTFPTDELHAFAASLDVKDNGRYATLPQSVVFSGLRRALEFSVSFGDAIIDSYINVARAAHAHRESAETLLDRLDIKQFLTDECKHLGITRWCISPTNASLNGRAGPVTKSDWYISLRNNEGLYEVLQVLYGAVYLVVGTLMARRAGELTELRADSYLDTSKTRLVFENRKSGFDDLRETEARPIPQIGVRLLRMFERLQSALIEMGAMESHGLLFATPVLKGRIGLRTTCCTSYSRQLNLFCDWAQLPVDSKGRRYYVRQHQLRRFFAMLFFWGGGFGGLDALRWFLGHTDPAHLWHYITESTPGAALRSVAAEWAASSISSGAPEFAALAALVEEHFGTSDISVIDNEALTAHLEDLLEDGVVRIEPQFLDGGSHYRIAVLIIPAGDTH
ncbi:hypothetical protein ABE493_08300 [Stenotrophomonas terrae]|uniref:hypothetical protein n=1 Tax=Stenotrophomonas terrae TaxID=405446 RepID=UPI003209659D